MENNQIADELTQPRIIVKRGLYSPQPLPAQIVLANAKEFGAQRVLLALSSYLGGVEDRTVYPTYEQIRARCGATASTVSKALNTLVELEFIYIYQSWKNGKKHNKYIFKDSCWHYFKMSEKARSYLPVIGDCFCGAEVREGDLLFGNTDYHHYNCGDIVTVRPTARGYKRALAKNRAEAMGSAWIGDLMEKEVS